MHRKCYRFGIVLAGVGALPHMPRHVLFLVRHRPAAAAVHLLLTIHADLLAFPLRNEPEPKVSG